MIFPFELPTAFLGKFGGESAAEFLGCSGTGDEDFNASSSLQYGSKHEKAPLASTTGASLPDVHLLFKWSHSF